MEKKTFSLGSKNPKKEIEIQVTKKHIFVFFIVLLFISFISIIVVNKYFGTVNNLELKCTTGEIEQVVQGKEVYCGQHYSVLNGLITPYRYNLIERQIIFGDVYDE